MGRILGELLDHLDFVCQRTNALLIYLMTKKHQGCSIQDTLGCTDVDNVVLQMAEDLA